VEIPDYTSLAKRAAALCGFAGRLEAHRPIDVVVDSTGLKVFGEGEWKVRAHGKSKRRTWRKLHLTVNPETQEIEAEVLTENSGHDADQVDDMLDQVAGPIDRFYGDGSYDPWKVRESLVSRGIEQVIPPRHDAKIKRHGNTHGSPLPRDQAVRDIRRLGRRRWKEVIGYHLRSLSETTMYRIKCCFGNRLNNRILSNQRTEARLRSKVLKPLHPSRAPAVRMELVNKALSIMNINLNVGGLIGALACGGLVGAIVFSSLDRTSVDRGPYWVIIVALIGGAFAGNSFWSRVFKKRR